MKTFIKWAGNKSRCLKDITKHLPSEYNVYYEPFVGSGALFISLAPHKWVINDFNKDIHNIWYALLHSKKTFIKYFKFYKDYLSILNNKDLLVECKRLTTTLNYNSRFNIKRCALYLILKSLVFHGHLMTKNEYVFSSFDSNVLTQDNIYVFSEKFLNNLLEISNLLTVTSGAIYNKDYKDILISCKTNDFVFLDPPYIEDRNYKFNYNKDEVLDDQFIKGILQECRKLDKRRVKWLMTQADTPIVRKLFSKYDIQEMKVYRHPRRAYVIELLIKNY